MNCEKAKDLQWGYYKQELTAEETAELEQHLEECAECRQEAELYKEMQEMLNDLPEEELPEGYHAELMQKLEKEAKKTETGKTEWAVIPFRERLAEQKKKQKEQKIRQKKQQKTFRQWGMVAAAAVLVISSGTIQDMWEQQKQHRHDLIYEAPYQAESVQTEDAADTADTAVMPIAEKTAVEQSRTTAEAGAGDTQVQPVQQPKEKKKTAEVQTAVPTQKAEESSVAAEPMVAAEEPQAIPQTAAYDTDAEEPAPMMARSMPAGEEELTEIISLQVINAEEAKAAIREQIKALNGQEEAAENSLIALLPPENTVAFYEALEELGVLSWIQTGGTAAPDSAYCKIEIQILEE